MFSIPNNSNFTKKLYLSRTELGKRLFSVKRIFVNVLDIKSIIGFHSNVRGSNFVQNNCKLNKILCHAGIHIKYVDSKHNTSDAILTITSYTDESHLDNVQLLIGDNKDAIECPNHPSKLHLQLLHIHPDCKATLELLPAEGFTGHGIREMSNREKVFLKKFSPKSDNTRELANSVNNTIRKMTESGQLKDWYNIPIS